LLRKSLETAQNQNWYALLHYGVMLAEGFNDPEAVAAWEASIEKTPSIWAYRNLAVLARSAGKTAEAIDLYQRAWELAVSSHQVPPAFVQEYLSLLNEAGEFQRAWNVCQRLPAQTLDFDPTQILIANIALKIGKLDQVETALRREYASIREGAVILTDLWHELWRRRMAEQSGRNPALITLEEIEAAHPPPPSIDFRMA
jgi:tetratricopeptide (TPR) repeat protein